MEHDSWVDRLKPAPKRTFDNPFAAWHYRTLDRSMYSTDLDGIDVVGAYPVIFFEVKTINRSLDRAIVEAGDKSSYTPHQLVADFFGRVNMWQVETLNRLVRPNLQTGIVLIGPSTC